MMALKGLTLKDTKLSLGYVYMYVRGLHNSIAMIILSPSAYPGGIQTRSPALQVDAMTTAPRRRQGYLVFKSPKGLQKNTKQDWSVVWRDRLRLLRGRAIDFRQGICICMLVCSFEI
jgi:hypothetical protein